MRKSFMYRLDFQRLLVLCTYITYIYESRAPVRHNKCLYQTFFLVYISRAKLGDGKSRVNG